MSRFVKLVAPVTDAQATRAYAEMVGAELDLTASLNAGGKPILTLQPAAVLTSNARVAVQTGQVGPFKRRKINLIAGAGVTIGLADQALTEQVDVTITASGGGGGTPAVSVVSEQAFGQTLAVGTGTNYARQDHTHGTPALGTTGATAAAGNDARLSDARTPTAHATSHQPGGTDPLEVDAVAATGSLRTLGTGATQAAAGADVRLSDPRAPTGAAFGQLGGTYPGPDVRGLRETAGPTLLTLGAVADGQVLKRVGSTIVGVFAAFMASVMDVSQDITNHADLGVASITTPTVVETATWSA